MNILENIGQNIENGINSFFQSSFGQVINCSLENGLKVLLPDFIEDDVIEIKDTLIEEGFGEAVNKAIDKAIELGKSAIGTITGCFESVSQVEKAVEKGGLIDGVSEALDYALDKAKESGFLSKDIVKVVKEGKNTILKGVSSDIKKEFDIQSDKIEKLNTYNEEWQNAYENHDIEKMDKTMKKIQKILNNVMPVENVIKKSREIENLHELIKNNGNDFSLTQEQLSLAEVLY